MRTHRLHWMALAGLALLMGSVTHAEGVPTPNPGSQDFGGIWMGVLQLPVESPPRIVLRVTRDADGRLKAYVENPDARDQHHADRVLLEKGHLRVEVDSMGGVLEGQVEEDRGHLEPGGPVVRRRAPAVARARSATPSAGAEAPLPL
jgi:hypothetical protein